MASKSFFSGKVSDFFNYLSKCKAELKHIKYPKKPEIYAKLVGVCIVSGAFSVVFLLIDILFKNTLSLFF
jgi:preprotein translocase SecE subunit